MNEKQKIVCPECHRLICECGHCEMEHWLGCKGCDVIGCKCTQFKPKTKMKIIKIPVTKKMQEELNEVRKECGFAPEPIKPDYELEALFG